MKQNSPPSGLTGLIAGIVLGLQMGWFGLPLYLVALAISEGKVRTISDMLNGMGEKAEFNLANEIGFQLGFVPWGFAYVFIFAVGIKLLTSGR